MSKPASFRNVLHYSNAEHDASQYPGSSPEGVSAKMALHDKLAILWRGKWLILIVFALVMAGTVAYTLSVAPEYEAYTLLMVDAQPSQGNAEPIAALNLLDGGGMSNRTVANQALIIQQSLAIAERTAEKLVAMKNVPATGEPLQILQRDEGTPPLTAEALARSLQGLIEVIPQDEGVDALWIRSTSIMPDEAALIANVFSEEYVERTRETSRQHLTVSRDFLEEQIAKLHSELTSTEDHIRQYRTANGAVDLDEETRYTIAQIAQLEAQLDEVGIDRQMHEASRESTEQELLQIQPRLAQRVASAADQEIEAAQAKIAALELHVEQVLLRNPELRANPDQNDGLRSIRNEVNQYKARVRELSDQYVEEMLAVGGIDPRKQDSDAGIGYVARLNQQLIDERITLSGLEAKEKALEQRLATYEQNLRSIPTQSTELAQMERTRQSTEQLYVSLVEKLQEARIAEQSELGFARIIRPAFAPTAPVRPRTGVNLTLGALLGLLFGLGAAVARHKLDTRVYTPEALRSSDHHLLSVIPDMQPLHRNASSQEEQKALVTEHSFSTLVPLVHPFSPAAEPYRHLYLRLLHSKHDEPLKTVLITSPEEAAGKSTTTINLGITAARAGKRTLIVDADLRQPALQTYLELSPRPCLGNLLDDPASLDPETFATGLPNLYAIPATPSDTNPSELLDSAQMRVLMERFEQYFDFIVFDSPPALLATDALVLAAQCDATVLVASAGRTSAEGLAHTVEELQEMGAAVVGTVLNRFVPSHPYGYQSMYGYQSAYYNRMRASN